jgi:hypothetical protein
LGPLPPRGLAKVDDNEFLRADGLNLAAFLYLLREKPYRLLQPDSARRTASDAILPTWNGVTKARTNISTPRRFGRHAPLHCLRDAFPTVPAVSSIRDSGG